jgi:translation initiation factor 6
MKVLKTNFNSNPNVGLYGYCTDEYCLLGHVVSDEKAKEVEKVLKVPVHRITMCGTSLAGVFLAGNSKTLLVPEIAFDNELKELDRLGIHYKTIKTHATAFGNNILCNDNGCVVSPEFTEGQRKKIGEALGVKVTVGTIAGLDIVGSVAVRNSKGCLVHRDIDDDEKKNVEKMLGLECTPSTINMGSPHLSSGILCNDNGMVVGDTSGGPELIEAEEALGLRNK